MALSKSSMQSVRYAVICLGGIIGFVMLSIFPTHRAIVTTDKKIAALTEKVEEQKVLYPLFKDLLEKSKSETPSQLPFPKSAKLSKEETEDISSFFQELARQNGFSVETIVPDVVSLTDGSGYLMLDAVLRGEFLKFRNLLLQLGEIPYLEKIESIQIRTVEDLKEFRLKLWIAQEE
jgi:hypothetical protein